MATEGGSGVYWGVGAGWGIRCLLGWRMEVVRGGGARRGGAGAQDGEGDGARVTILFLEILYGLFPAQEEG